MNLSQQFGGARSGKIGGSRLRRSLVELSRHTSRDTVVIASALTARNVIEDRSELNLSSSDVDGLSAVVQKLTGRQLNLVLHGAGGDLAAAAEAVSLLRGRFESIRALVPNCALSAMALVACACDAVMMPETAVIGVLDDDHHTPVSADEARGWLFRNCFHPDLPERVEATGLAFSACTGPRGALSACLAKELGMPVNIVPEQSALGLSLQEIWQGLEDTMRDESLVKLIGGQKGPIYSVECC
jgi:hypothetical protein